MVWHEAMLWIQDCCHFGRGILNIRDTRTVVSTEQRLPHWQDSSRSRECERTGSSVSSRIRKVECFTAWVAKYWKYLVSLTQPQTLSPPFTLLCTYIDGTVV